MGQDGERKIRPGELYRHFEGELYQIAAVASQWETGEAMVVYQELFGSFRVLVQPYSRFIREVDQEMYPKAGQRYRYERVCAEGRNGTETKEEPGDKTERAARQEMQPEGEQETGAGGELEKGACGPNPALMRFLTAETLEEKIACLNGLAETASQSDIESIYMVLDMKPQSGSIQEQISAIRGTLAIQRHYEGVRLR